MMTKDPARIVTSDALDPMGGRQMPRVSNKYAMDGTTFEGQSQGREASDDLGAGLYANLPSFTLSALPFTCDTLHGARVNVPMAIRQG